MDKCPGHFALSRYLADELPAGERREVSAHLEACERCSALLRDRAEYAELAEERYAAAWQQAVAARPHEAGRARRPRRASFWVFRVLVPVAAAAVILALVVPRLAPPPPVRYKGSLSLQIIAKRGERQFVVSDGARLCPGDALRFSVTASGAKSYLVILSLDRRGTLSTFYPNSTTPPRLRARSGTIVELTGAGRHVLPGSIILDRSQGREVILLLASRQAFDPRPLQARIRAISSKDPRAAERLTGEKLGFSGAVRAVPIVKSPCL